MTREIKFRAWDNKLKKMIFFKDFSLENTGGFWNHNESDNREVYQLSSTYGEGKCDGFGYFHVDFSEEVNDFLLMQYTGLKDCNGKEIYEGDIVKSLVYEEGDISEVIWDDGLNIFPFHYYSEGKDYEVIGNIYEHPSLLEKK